MRCSAWNKNFITSSEFQSNPYRVQVLEDNSKQVVFWLPVEKGLFKFPTIWEVSHHPTELLIENSGGI